MTLIDRLRTEAQREPHEPIWLDAIRELERHGELLLIMGRIAHELRGLVGGMDINGFDYRSATIESAAITIPRLRPLLNEYDRIMTDMAREKAKD